MNKFIHEPDSLGSLVGCAIWMGLLAAGMAILFTTLYEVFGRGILG